MHAGAAAVFLSIVADRGGVLFFRCGCESECCGGCNHAAEGVVGGGAVVCAGACVGVCGCV